MTPEELLAHATEFVFTPTVEEGEQDVEAFRHFRVYVQWRGADKYAISRFGEVWNGEDWEYESLPSNRTDEFIAKTRFSLDEAVAMAKDLPDKLSVNGRTYREWYAIQRSDK